MLALIHVIGRRKDRWLVENLKMLENALYVCQLIVKKTYLWAHVQETYIRFAMNV